MKNISKRLTLAKKLYLGAVPSLNSNRCDEEEKMSAETKTESCSNNSELYCSINKTGYDLWQKK